MAVSPTPKNKPKRDNLTFIEALQAVMEGNSISKVEWKDKSSHGLLYNGRLSLCLKGKYHDWILSDGDLYGDDFFVL